MVRKIINIASTVLLIAMIALVVFLFVIRMNGNTPSLFGYSVYRVQTGSMEPTLKVGEVILVKSCDPEDIHEGDIITYKMTYGSLAGQTITHRVAQEPEVRNGVYYFRTKGDNNNALDEEITFDVIQGKYVKTLALVDRLYSFFLSPLGLIVFIGVIVLLFGYEMIALIVSYKATDEKDEDYYAPKNKKPKKKRTKHKQIFKKFKPKSKKPKTAKAQTKKPKTKKTKAKEKK